MDQQIAFCTASDGVRIAYAVVGSGPPLVYVCGWPEHLQLEWEKPFSRAFLEALAEGSTLIRYDMRGSGLSDADVSDFSLESLSRDLEAVVDALKLEQFALLSLGILGGPIAIRYAAQRPERVAHLILYGAFVRGEDLLPEERRTALIDYVSKFGFPHFDFIDHPGVGVEEQRDIRDMQQAAAPPAMQAALLRTLYSADVGPMLDRLTMPTLVLQGDADRMAPFAGGRDLAARLPCGKFVPYEGGGPPWANSRILIPQAHEFLGVEVKTPLEPQKAQGLVIILFTDIEGSTALTQRLGDERARQLLRTHEDIVRRQLRSAGGTEIKTMGDGFMLSFPSASRALECAIALQRAFDAHNREHPDAQVRIRVGLNAGEPIAEEGDLFGTAVIAAARVAAQAVGGEILASDVVRQLVAGKGFLFSDRGPAALRGFDDPVRLYEVHWEAPSA